MRRLKLATHLAFLFIALVGFLEGADKSSFHLTEDESQIKLVADRLEAMIRIRVSTHIHTRKSDLDLLFQTIQEGLT